MSAETVHAAELDLIPRGAGPIAVDVGAGSGRDTAWLASLRYQVVATEPAAGMRREGQLRGAHLRARSKGGLSTARSVRRRFGAQQTVSM